MDFLQLIPSQTVADHVRKTGYKLTAIDAVCIVRDSDYPLKSKHEAYREIIATMPDCKLGGSTLHTVLSNLIKQEEQILALFQNDENSTYTCVVHVKTENTNLIFEDEKLSEKYQGLVDKIFTNLRDCIQAISSFPKEYLQIGYTIEVVKNNDIHAYFDYNLQLISIFDGSGEYMSADAAMIDLKLNRKFPLPFASGDLVCDCTSSRYISSSNQLEECDLKVRVIQILEVNREKAYEVYSLFYKSGGYYRDKHCSLLRCELVDKKSLPSKYFFLIAISSFFKEEIDLEQFLRVYDYFKIKCQSDRFPSKFKKELRKSGIKID